MQLKWSLSETPENHQVKAFRVNKTKLQFAAFASEHEQSIDSANYLSIHVTRSLLGPFLYELHTKYTELPTTLVA